MNLYDILRYGHGIIHIIIHIAIMAGIFLEWKRGKRAIQAAKARVSVIIPVHNESARMGGLTRTLMEQTYKAQIVFVNDRSSDESPAILAQFAKDAAVRGIDCRIITLTENPGPNFKQYALSRGITEADGDFFLFTDGDCEVPPDWIRTMISRIQDEKTGAVIGPVFKKKQEKGFFSLFQCYDHVLRYNYLAGATGMGAAGGGFGNNLIISRKALDAAGGYDAIPPSPTEDAALISIIRGKYNVRAITSGEAAVETEPEKTWRSFINQTLRWNNGGLFSPEALTRFNFNLLAVIIGTGILAIPLLPFIPGLWPLSAGVFINMIINTIAAFALFRKNLSHNGSPGYFLCLLFMPFYFTMINIMGYLRIKTTWKEKDLIIKKN
ncbi:MAG: glycosyltransferase [Treponema sp.]|nr:glycosyltransferase [Treponema sp.]